MIWPAWVYCTRYSDRPSAGPRAKRTRKKEGMSSISYNIVIQAWNPFSFLMEQAKVLMKVPYGFYRTEK